jgi:hypothetical protein
MKKINTILGVILFIAISVNAQEKKIEFNKGILEIRSSKNFTIKGYDGKEVVIKSLHGKRSYTTSSFSNLNGASISRSSNSNIQGSARLTRQSQNSKNIKTDSIARSYSNVFFTSQDKNRKKGLKKLGRKQQNQEYGIYFTIEQKDGLLTFEDNQQNFMMFSDESYEIMIPNTLKLRWTTSGASGQGAIRFYNSKSSSLSDFNGEVEISSSLNNMKLKDVVGPVSINTIGGNITIEFDKKTPQKLYSIYSNNGFIDVTLPSSSDILVDGEGNAIYSDIDFKVLEEKDDLGRQQMRLKLKNGSVKMKLNAGLGSIYLRKK